MTEIERCIDEQRRCRDYLDGPGEDKAGAWMGMTDWLMEEAILRTDLPKPYYDDGKGIVIYHGVDSVVKYESWDRKRATNRLRNTSANAWRRKLAKSIGATRAILLRLSLGDRGRFGCIPLLVHAYCVVAQGLSGTISTETR